MSVRNVVGRLFRREAKAPTAVPAGSPRTDPDPPPADFPAVRYVVVVESIPRLYAGRTASILAKARSFATRGVDTEILVLGHSGELDEVRATIDDRGALPAGSSIRSLYEWIDDDTAERRPSTAPSLTPDGLTHVEQDGGVHRYLADGALVRELVCDRDGRVRVAREYDTAGVIRRVEDFDANGALRHEAEFVPGDTKPRLEVYYRNNGSPAFRRLRQGEPDAEPKALTETVEVFDGSGELVETLDSWAGYVHRLLDRFAAGQRLFVTVEARVCDPLILGWEYPLARQLYVLHNPHILPPYDDPARIRGGFKALFRARDRVTTVFLTNAQRADAEARFGHCDNFWVIPHAVRQPGATTSPPDPHKAVMVARLTEQKRIDRAIDAFAQVVATIPSARLEIYGSGPLHDQLTAQVERLGLAGSIVLKGYTTATDECFAGAAVSVLSSEFEALGLTLVESLSNRCPAVAFDIRYGPSDVIDHGRNGLLVPAGDEPALAAAILAVLGDPARREAMAAQADGILQQFSEQTYLNRWAALFARLDVAGWG